MQSYVFYLRFEASPAGTEGEPEWIGLHADQLIRQLDAQGGERSSILNAVLSLQDTAERMDVSDRVISREVSISGTAGLCAGIMRLDCSTVCEPVPA